MKNNLLKYIVVMVFSVLICSCILGCNDSKDEVVTSEEIISEEVSEEISEEMSAENNETVSVETSEEVSEDDSEETTEEKSEEVSEEASAETSETISEEVSEEPAPAYTVEPMTATMYVQRSVNVRKGPGTEYEKVGSLDINQEVAVTGKASTGWYEISYNGEVAYVSNNYLGNEKVVVQPAPTTPSASETTTPATPNAGTGGTTENVGETTYTVYLEPNMLGLVNGHRTANGVPALTWNSAKEQEALDRAKAISANFSHAGNPADCENIAYSMGYGDANTFYTQYYNSPGHNQVMLHNDANATSQTMVSATCVVTTNGFSTYYNVLLIYKTYPDNFASWEW